MFMSKFEIKIDLLHFREMLQLDIFYGKTRNVKKVVLHWNDKIKIFVVGYLELWNYPDFVQHDRKTKKDYYITHKDILYFQLDG